MTQRLVWDGVARDGEVAPNGTYRVRLAAPDGTARNAGTFTLHSHIYPIRGPHADRGPIGAFGVGRNGGRTHEGFDVNAACGTKLVAARGGRVIRSGYDPVLYGNIVIVRGERTQRDYWYAHLERRRRCARATACAPASGSGASARPATRARSAATCTSRSAAPACRSTRRPSCTPGTPGAEWPVSQVRTRLDRR